MNTSPKNLYSYLKSGILSFLLCVLSYLLAQTIYVPIREQNYFLVDLKYIADTVGLMLLLLYVFSLTVGMWNKWEQYVLAALPIVLGLFLVLGQIDLFYGLLISVFLFALFGIDITKSVQLSKLLIKFKPALVMSLSSSGLMFAFSAIGGLMVIISASNLPKFDLGKSLADISGPYIKNIVRDQLKQQTQGMMPNLSDEELNQLDPSMRELYKEGVSQVNSSTDSYINSTDFSKVMEIQINNFIEPYKNLLNPILAILMFVQFQFFASIAKFIFNLTVGGLFYLAKKSGFIKTETVTVEKEVLKF